MAEIILGGQRYTNRPNAPDVMVRDVSSKIVQKQPMAAPFYTATAKVGSEASDSMKVEHEEDDVVQPFVVVDGAVSTASTINIKVDDGSGNLMAVKIRKNAVLLRDSGETLFVNSSNAATGYINVTTNFNSIGATNIADNEVLRIVQEGFEEGGTFVSAISGDGVMAYNYLQEMEFAVEMSNIQRMSKTYTERDWAYQVDKAMRAYKEQRERTFWAGTRYMGVGANSKRLYLTGGMDEFITGGGIVVTQASSVLTKRMIEEWLVQIIVNGEPDQLCLYGSPSAWLALSNVADGYVTIPRSEATLGLTIQRVYINGRTIPFIENRQFSSNRLNWPNRLYAINHGHVRLRYLEGDGDNGKTKWFKNVQENDRKGRKDVIYGIEGLQRENAPAHGKLTFAL